MPKTNTVQNSASQFIAPSQIANSLSIARITVKLTTTGSAIKPLVLIRFQSKCELSVIIHTTSTGDLVRHAMQLAVKYLHCALKHAPTGVVAC